MGRGHSGVRCVSSDGSIGLFRQADAAAHVGDIRSDGGTNGRCSSRGLDGLSDTRPVGLSALQQKPEALREDMFHQVRNLAQPLVMVIPMLYAGMLLGGVPALEGLLVTLLLTAASFVANILAGVIALKNL